MKHLIQILKPIIFLFLLPHVFMNAQAFMVNKSQLPYEIMSIQVSDAHMHIQGWAFISYKQHFHNAGDHAVELEFTSLNHSFRVNAPLYANSKTDLMHYFGSPYCAENSTNQASEVCNYHYNNVGFNISVPLSHFRSNETYQTNIVVHAFTAGLSYKTPVYYPMQNDLVFNKNNHEYRFISRLYDTELKVNATTVIARKSPGKAVEVWYYGSNCSSTYLNQLFFQIDTVYKTVYEKFLLDDTSYYRLGARTSICLNSRRRIIEGTILQPVWIASPYVLYSGSPLQIHVKPLNQAPYFIGNAIELYIGEPLVITDHIKAHDFEDGNLTHAIIVLENTYVNEIGDYFARLIVSDSQNLSTSHIVSIKVIPLPNEKPIIFAYDQTLMQYQTFDPFHNVSAFDKEDGDLTHQINLDGSIDTSQLGNQTLCYYVYDSQFERGEKCITINIISYSEMINQFRFISKNYLFYQESIPIIWLDKLFILDNILYEENLINKFEILD